MPYSIGILPHALSTTYGWRNHHPSLLCPVLFSSLFLHLLSLCLACIIAICVFSFFCTSVELSCLQLYSVFPDDILFSKLGYNTGRYRKQKIGRFVLKMGTDQSIVNTSCNISILFSVNLNTKGKTLSLRGLTLDPPLSELHWIMRMKEVILQSVIIVGSSLWISKSSCKGK